MSLSESDVQLLARFRKRIEGDRKWLMVDADAEALYALACRLANEAARRTRRKTK
jgi:hypothetical protein